MLQYPIIGFGAAIDRISVVIFADRPPLRTPLAHPSAVAISGRSFAGDVG